MNRYIKILLPVLILTFSWLANCLASTDARYVKVLIDKGVGGSYNGKLTISELEIFDVSNNNIAGSGLVTAASYFGVGYPSKAFDGNYSTNYATSETFGLSPAGMEWLLVDLGSVQQISSIKLSTSSAFNSAVITDYRILVSTDGISYQSVVTVAGASPVTRTDSHLMPSGSASSPGFYYEIKLSSASGADLAITFAIFFGIVISTGFIAFFGGVVVRMVYPSYHSGRGWY
jgi:hypothetical protein